MPINLDKAYSEKERIMNYIKSSGPSIPVRISTALGMQTLFVSAFLSELYNDRRLRMSNMKVGSSPIYFIQGQEELLENFIQYLNNREREAFELIKQKKVLDDEKLSPVMRVAVRAIKDFAFPFKAKIRDEIKNFWKYHLLKDEEIKGILEDSLRENIISPSLNTEENIQKELRDEKVINLPQKEEKKNTSEEANSEKITQQNSSEKIQEKINQKDKKKTQKKVQDSEFLNKLKEYLNTRNIEIIEQLEEKKKDYQAKIRIDTLFGKQYLLLHAKDKKKIGENDLTILHQKSQTERMPGILISPGELDSKAKTYLEKWNNLIKFEKLKF